MRGVCTVSTAIGGLKEAPKAPAPWGSPPTPLLPRWYIEALASTPLPAALVRAAEPDDESGVRMRTVGDLPSFWGRRSAPIPAEFPGVLVSVVGNLFPPMDLEVLPAGTNLDRLLSCPLRTRTRNCLIRAVHQTKIVTDQAATVGQLVVIPNFGLMSLLDLMCIAEAANGNGFLRHSPTDRQQHQDTSHGHPSSSQTLEAPGPREVAWRDAADPLGTLMGVAADFRGARTLGDALRVDLGELAGLLGLEDDLDGILVDDLRSALGPTQETVAAIDDLWDRLTPREQAILIERLLAPEPLTLEKIAARFGITRERIRQMEKQLKREFRSPDGRAADVSRCVGRVAALVRADLPPVIPVGEFERVLHETFPPSPSSGGSDAGMAGQVARSMLQDELAYSCSDKICLSPDATALVEDLQSASRELADDVGLLRESELRDRLPEGIWHEHWDTLLDCCGLRRFDDHLALRDTAKARVKAALLAIGRPATKEELAERCSLMPQQVAGQMSLIEGIARADKARWGLTEWIDDVYEGIPAEIIQRIEEDGGATPLARLLEELPRLFGVQESSVRAYVGTPRFRLRHGHVSLTDVSSLALRPLGDVVDGTTAHGNPYWCFAVEQRYFDGYSLAGVPTEIVDALGCEPDGHARVTVTWPDACRPLSASWPLASIAGPTIGYLSDPLRRLEARAGDRIRLVIEGTRLASLHLDTATDDAPSLEGGDNTPTPHAATESPEGDRSRAILDRMKKRRGGH